MNPNDTVNWDRISCVIFVFLFPGVANDNPGWTQDSDCNTSARYDRVS